MFCRVSTPPCERGSEEGPHRAFRSSTAWVLKRVHRLFFGETPGGAKTDREHGPTASARAGWTELAVRTPRRTPAPAAPPRGLLRLRAGGRSAGHVVRRGGPAPFPAGRSVPPALRWAAGVSVRRGARPEDPAGLGGDAGGRSASRGRGAPWRRGRLFPRSPSLGVRAERAGSATGGGEPAAGEGRVGVVRGRRRGRWAGRRGVRRRGCGPGVPPAARGFPRTLLAGPTLTGWPPSAPCQRVFRASPTLCREGGREGRPEGWADPPGPRTCRRLLPGTSPAPSPAVWCESGPGTGPGAAPAADGLRGRAPPPRSRRLRRVDRVPLLSVPSDSP